MRSSRIPALCLTIVLHLGLHAQGFFSGDLELRNDYYVRDSLIGAAETPQYDFLKTSIDAWLQLNYSNPDIELDAGIRLDFFQNSNLHNPGLAYSRVGIGRWFVRKRFDDLTLTGGVFYDQFGSGLTFRAYEDRFLGIDNGIFGIHGSYDLRDVVTIKAFTGVRKNRLDLHKSLVSGVNAEGYWTVGENLTLAPGVSAVNRTIDRETMSNMVSQINGYPLEERFQPKHNTAVFSAYNRLDYKRFSWFFEAAFKTREAQITPVSPNFINEPGNAFLTTFTYSRRGFGVTAQFKRTENFQFRNSPVDVENTTILSGALNFIPPINRQNSLRLPARYAPASQEIQEVGMSVDFTFKPHKKWAFNVSYSQIHDLNVTLGDFANDLIAPRSDIDGLRNHSNTLLFKELYFDAEWRINRRLKWMFGNQVAVYNQEFYEGPAGKPLAVFVYSPFTEFTWRMTNRQSLRFELQYQSTKLDFGQWVHALIEYNIAPKWSFSVQDMWNVQTNPKNELSVARATKTGEASRIEGAGLHYFSVFTSFTHQRHRISAAYVKQVAGIVCTGGVCRFEPAFSGVRLNLLTSF